MSLDRFKQFAAYNRWANARLYTAALDLSDQSYRLHIGVSFGGLHGTLNHLLLTDRIWLKRLTGQGDHPNELDAILYEDRLELTLARMAEDERLIGVIESYDEPALKHCTATRPHQECRNRRSSERYCCISSTTRSIIVGRRMPAYQY
jgi:uncharacterized damage-inducible protein DinB